MSFFSGDVALKTPRGLWTSHICKFVGRGRGGYGGGDGGEGGGTDGEEEAEEGADTEEDRRALLLVAGGDDDADDDVVERKRGGRLGSDERRAVKDRSSSIVALSRRTPGGLAFAAIYHAGTTNLPTLARGSSLLPLRQRRNDVVDTDRLTATTRRLCHWWCRYEQDHNSNKHSNRGQLARRQLAQRRGGHNLTSSSDKRTQTRKLLSLSSQRPP